MKLLIGSDLLGHELKEVIKEHLTTRGHTVHDASPAADDVDYPDVAEVVAKGINEGHAELGVLVCGTGIGMAIAANKVPGIRAANVADPYSAERARASNDAQILCLGAKVVGADVAKILVDHWLGAEFQGGGSARKVQKLIDLDHAKAAPDGH